MNKTRKKIIELIEPYMDKSLKKWCLFKLFNSDEIREVDWYFEYEWPWNYLDDQFLFPTDMREWHEKDNNVVEKVYWHYDITSIDKYLWFEKKIYSVVKWNVKILYSWNKEVGDIPNKNLNLYSEEEDKYLYNKLINLK